MYYFDSGYNSPEPEAEEGVEVEYEPVVNFDLELYRYQRRQQFLEDYLESLNIQYNQFVLSLNELKRQDYRRKQLQKRFKKIKKANRRQNRLNKKANRKN